MENSGLNLKATELRLGLPGSDSSTPDEEERDEKISSASVVLSLNMLSSSSTAKRLLKETNCSPKPDKKTQVIGWPPIRSFRKNTMSSSSSHNSAKNEEDPLIGCVYVKVSMDGAPYLRKVDLKTYASYMELSSGLEKMFSCFTIGQCGSHNAPGREGLSESRLIDILHGSEYVLTYEDKDGDWMLVGDVPWNMFTGSCKRLRIMKSSDAIGLAPRAMEKCRNRN